MTKWPALTDWKPTRVKKTDTDMKHTGDNKNPLLRKALAVFMNCGIKRVDD